MILMSVLDPTSATKCVPTLRDHSPVDVRQDMCWTVTVHHVLVNVICCNCVTFNKMVTAITCSDVPTISNGVIVYSSDTTEPYNYGTTATYECDTGYELTSGNKKRNCTKSGLNSEGIWNGIMPTCSGIVVCEFIGICHNHGYV